MLNVLLVTILFPAVCFLPGWLLAQGLGRGSGERFAVAWGIGAAILAGSHVTAFVLGADPRIVDAVLRGQRPFWGRSSSGRTVPVVIHPRTETGGMME